MRAPRFAFLLPAIVLAAPAAAQDQRDAVIRIHVIDAATRRPVDGAQLRALQLFDETDEDGNAILTGIAPGDHDLEITRLGYGPASVSLRLFPAQWDPKLGIHVT